MSISSDTSKLGITVTGSGEVVTLPDVFVLYVGAEAMAERAVDATAQASAALTRMREVALEHGVRPEGIATKGLSLQQVHDRDGNRQGIKCSLDLVLRSGDLVRSGVLASACVEAGGQEARLQSVAFEHHDPREFYVRARELAFADALARATQLTGLAGRELGGVEQITEGTYGGQGGLRYDSLQAPPIPIAGGTLEFSTMVTVRWSWV
jgi:uncharacterized protein YggE